MNILEMMSIKLGDISGLLIIEDQMTKEKSQELIQTILSVCRTEDYMKHHRMTCIWQHTPDIEFAVLLKANIKHTITNFLEADSVRNSITSDGAYLYIYDENMSGIAKIGTGFFGTKQGYQYEFMKTDRRIFSLSCTTDMLYIHSEHSITAIHTSNLQDQDIYVEFPSSFNLNDAVVCSFGDKLVLYASGILYLLCFPESPYKATLCNMRMIKKSSTMLSEIVDFDNSRMNLYCNGYSTHFMVSLTQEEIRAIIKSGYNIKFDMHEQYIATFIYNMKGESIAEDIVTLNSGYIGRSCHFDYFMNVFWLYSPFGAKVSCILNHGISRGFHDLEKQSYDSILELIHDRSVKYASPLYDLTSPSTGKDYFRIPFAIEATPECILILIRLISQCQPTDTVKLTYFLGLLKSHFSWYYRHLNIGFFPEVAELLTQFLMSEWATGEIKELCIQIAVVGWSFLFNSPEKRFSFLEMLFSQIDVDLKLLFVDSFNFNYSVHCFEENIAFMFGMEEESIAIERYELLSEKILELLPYNDIKYKLPKHIAHIYPKNINGVGTFICSILKSLVLNVTTNKNAAIALADKSLQKCFEYLSSSHEDQVKYSQVAMAIIDLLSMLPKKTQDLSHNIVHILLKVLTKYQGRYDQEDHIRESFIRSLEDNVWVEKIETPHPFDNTQDIIETISIPSNHIFNILIDPQSKITSGYVQLFRDRECKVPMSQKMFFQSKMKKMMRILVPGDSTTIKISPSYDISDDWGFKCYVTAARFRKKKMQYNLSSTLSWTSRAIGNIVNNLSDIPDTKGKCQNRELLDFFKDGLIYPDSISHLDPFIHDFICTDVNSNTASSSIIKWFKERIFLGKGNKDFTDAEIYAIAAILHHNEGMLQSVKAFAHQIHNGENIENIPHFIIETSNAVRTVCQRIIRLSQDKLSRADILYLLTKEEVEEKKRKFKAKTARSVIKKAELLLRVHPNSDISYSILIDFLYDKTPAEVYEDVLEAKKNSARRWIQANEILTTVLQTITHPNLITECLMTSGINKRNMKNARVFYQRSITTNFLDGCPKELKHGMSSTFLNLMKAILPLLKNYTLTQNPHLHFYVMSYISKVASLHNFHLFAKSSFTTVLLNLIKADTRDIQRKDKTQEIIASIKELSWNILWRLGDISLSVKSRKKLKIFFKSYLSVVMDIIQHTGTHITLYQCHTLLLLLNGLSGYAPVAENIARPENYSILLSVYKKYAHSDLRFCIYKLWKTVLPFSDPNTTIDEKGTTILSSLLNLAEESIQSKTIVEGIWPQTINTTLYTPYSVLAWHNPEKSPRILDRAHTSGFIDADLLQFSYGGEESKYAYAHTTRSVPQNCAYFYFEVKIIKVGELNMGIGLHSSAVDFQSNLPGMYTGSLGFISADGKCYLDQQPSSNGKYGTPWNHDGDVVGLFWNVKEGVIFFTYNGMNLGNAFYNVSGEYFPVVVVSKGAKIEFNCGRWPFVYKNVSTLREDTAQPLETIQKEVLTVLEKVSKRGEEIWEETISLYISESLKELSKVVSHTNFYEKKQATDLNKYRLALMLLGGYKETIRVGSRIKVENRIGTVVHVSSLNFKVLIEATIKSDRGEKSIVTTLKDIPISGNHHFETVSFVSPNFLSSDISVLDTIDKILSRFFELTIIETYASFISDICYRAVLVLKKVLLQHISWKLNFVKNSIFPKLVRLALQPIEFSAKDTPEPLDVQYDAVLTHRCHSPNFGRSVRRFAKPHIKCKGHHEFSCFLCKVTPIRGNMYCNANVPGVSLCEPCYTVRQEKTQIFYRVCHPLPSLKTCPSWLIPVIQDTSSLAILPFCLNLDDVANNNRDHDMPCSNCYNSITGIRYMSMTRANYSICEYCDTLLEMNKSKEIFLVIEHPLPKDAFSSKPSPILPNLYSETELSNVISYTSVYIGKRLRVARRSQSGNWKLQMDASIGQEGIVIKKKDQDSLVLLQLQDPIDNSKTVAYWYEVESLEYYNRSVQTLSEEGCNSKLFSLERALSIHNARISIANFVSLNDTFPVSMFGNVYNIVQLFKLSVMDNREVHSIYRLNMTFEESKTLVYCKKALKTIIQREVISRSLKTKDIKHAAILMARKWLKLVRAKNANIQQKKKRSLWKLDSGKNILKKKWSYGSIDLSSYSLSMANPDTRSTSNFWQIELKNITSIKETAKTNGKNYCFEIKTPGEVFILAAESEEERKQWMGSIIAASNPRRTEENQILRIRRKRSIKSAKQSILEFKSHLIKGRDLATVTLNVEQIDLVDLIIGDCISNIIDPSDEEYPYVLEESSHPYRKNISFKRWICLPEAHHVIVIFDRRCHTDTGKDFLTFWKDASFTRPLSIFHGKGHQNFQPVVIESNEFWMTFESIDGEPEWGYKFWVLPFSPNYSDQSILTKPIFDYGIYTMEWLLDFHPIWIRPLYCKEIFNAIYHRFIVLSFDIPSRIRTLISMTRLLVHWELFDSEDKPQLNEVFLTVAKEISDIYAIERESIANYHSQYLRELFEFMVHLIHVLELEHQPEELQSLLNHLPLVVLESAELVHTMKRLIESQDLPSKFIQESFSYDNQINFISWIEESHHPYLPNSYFSSEISFPGATSLEILFDPRCVLGTDKAVLLFKNLDGNEVASFSSCIPPTFVFQGDCLTWHFISSNWSGEWGFRFLVKPIYPSEWRLQHERTICELLDKFNSQISFDWNLARDTQLINMANSIGVLPNLHSDNSLPTGVHETLGMFLRDDELSNYSDEIVYLYSKEILQYKYNILRYFNIKAFEMIPFVDLRKVNEPWSLAYLIGILRNILFSQAKMDWISSTLQEMKTNLKRPHLNINRKCNQPLYEQAYLQFKQIDSIRLQRNDRAFGVSFLNEGSIDVGGLYRETLSQMCREIQKSQTLFLPTPNNTESYGPDQDKFISNPAAQDQKQLSYFEFIGKLCGIAIRTKNPLEFDWPSIIWKPIVGLAVGIEDLINVDLHTVKLIELISNLTKFEGNIPEEMFEHLLPQNFATRSIDGREIQLIEKGSLIKINKSNIKLYLESLSQYKIHEFKDQVNAIIKGISSIIPLDILLILNAEEIETRICGLRSVDINLLKKNTLYNQVDNNAPHINYFWNVVSNFTQDQRQLLVRFISGRSRLPVDKEWPNLFIINKFLKPNEDRPDDEYLPRSHTCFFSLDLPEYSSEEIMKHKLIYAITSCVDMDGDFLVGDNQ